MSVAAPPKTETVRVPIAKSHRTAIKVTLTEGDAGWRVQLFIATPGDIGLNEPVSGLFANRDLALEAGLEEAVGYFSDLERTATAAQEARSQVATAEIRKMLKKVRAGLNSGSNGKPVPAASRAVKHPATTSTTTPAGIAANDRSAKGFTDDAQPAGDEPLLISVALASLDRHPDNRVPAEAKVVERMESLQRDGQLEPIVVRPIGKRYQIVSGETRSIAAGRLKWKTLLARVIHVDDAEALRLLAAYNAQRADLDPIQKAKLIRRLGEPVAAGGGGLTREAAAKEVGLESHSAAANLVRLLELPDVWQERVASSELPQTFARSLLALVPAPKLLDQANSAWGKDGSSWQWKSRDNVEQMVHQIIRGHTRPIEPQAFHYYNYPEVGSNQGRYPMLFELTDSIRAKLDIRTISIDDADVQVATNCKAYDKLQIPAIKRYVAEEAKKRAAKEPKAKAKKAEPEKKLTAAQKRKAAKEEAEQLAAKVEAWRHRWLRTLIAERLDDYPDVGERIATWLLSNCMRGQYDAKLEEIFEEAAGGKTMLKNLNRKKVDRPREDAWSLVLHDHDEELFEIRREMARGLLLQKNRDDRRPIIPVEVVDALAREVELDLTKEWYRLQDAATVDSESPLLVEFYGLHTSAQLDDLASETHALMIGGTKATKVESLCGQQINVPKAIRDWSKA